MAVLKKRLSSVGTTFADDTTVGSQGWTNPSNAGAVDGSNAECASLPGLGSQSYYLKATGFGFAVPTGSTILGVRLTVIGFATSASSTTWECKLVKGGTISGTNHSMALSTTVGARMVTGGSADLWGVALTAADVNGSTFGVVVSALNSSASTWTFDIDCIELEVFYTPPAEYGRDVPDTFPKPRLRSA